MHTLRHAPTAPKKTARRRLSRALIVLAALIGILTVSPSAASAHSISGSWSDNHTLCTSASSCIAAGHIVRFWQHILVTEYPRNPEGDFIDGQFGPNTKALTEQWQEDHGLTADGWVGPNTWSAAFDEIYRDSSNDTTSQLGYSYCEWYEYGYCMRELEMRRTVTTSTYIYYDREWGRWEDTSHY